MRVILTSSSYSILLTGNQLHELPNQICRFKYLKVLFFAQNNFEAIPPELGQLPNLFMLSFKSNKLKHIDETSLSPSIGWLILTDNLLTGR